jgi:DNA-binding ferritin-like protein
MESAIIANARLSISGDLIYQRRKVSDEIDQETSMSKPSIEQTRMGSEGIAFCIARTLIERDPSLKAPMRANLRKMWELLEEREDHGAADMVDTMIKALNDPAFFKP